jgi:broad-specificity NMP kinase
MTASRPPRPPKLVELAGPAGAGKSTVSLALRRRCPTETGTIWGLPVLPLLGNGVQLVPTLFGFWWDSRSLLWDESRHMVRLRTLQRELDQAQPDQVLVFDEGPVFALAWLRGFGHDSMRRDVSAAWWGATLRQWARTVDVVVVLDAPDNLLAQRIRARPIWHEVKAASDSDISIWMARFRGALDWVLAGLSRHDGPTIIRIATDRDPPEQVAERVFSALYQTSRDN